MEQIKLLAAEVARILEKLYKLQKIDVPQFFTDGFATVQSLLGLAIVIFAAVLVFQAVIMCMKKKFPRAAVLTLTAGAAVAARIILVPQITALGAWIWTF